ncbi:hypothetical protein LbFV_ORF104 [Leptopilina boulardi filamentous virus]|uniref:Peptidase M10 metallopeptidase domain-containing protein n=1 Tax=Leptopilina boulardi filamentous virus TaxID=552509 RepID=A0A1S5YDF7_9VIRU|nr:hypothetical protein LbFV_ORF104 [Leptopilina boulardi filamentous virus]AQQ80024.1 hypothetical protein LbFV_ORF104 [Leptopilina boulardi filamentous virus]
MIHIFFKIIFIFTLSILIYIICLLLNAKPYLLPLCVLPHRKEKYAIVLNFIDSKHFPTYLNKHFNQNKIKEMIIEINYNAQINLINPDFLLDDPYRVNGTKNNALGQTNIEFVVDGPRAKGFSTDTLAYAQSYYLICFNLKQEFNMKKLKEVLLHEVGHCMGLPHSGADESTYSVMSAFYKEDNFKKYSKKENDYLYKHYHILCKKIEDYTNLLKSLHVDFLN